MQRLPYLSAVPSILLTHSPETLAQHYGERALDPGRIAGCALDVGRAPDQMPTPALAARAEVIATPHTAGLTLPAIEHQSLETVAQAAEILKGRAPKGAVNAEHWTRKGLLKP